MIGCWTFGFGVGFGLPLNQANLSSSSLLSLFSWTLLPNPLPYLDIPLRVPNDRKRGCGATGGGVVQTVSVGAASSFSFAIWSINLNYKKIIGQFQDYNNNWNGSRNGKFTSPMIHKSFCLRHWCRLLAWWASWYLAELVNCSTSKIASWSK